MRILIVISISIFSGSMCVFALPAISQFELTRNVKNSINRMSLDFTKIVLNNSNTEENFVFSPLNICSALALVHLGATGSTKSELSKICGLSVEDSELAGSHKNFGKLLNTIQTTFQNSTTVTFANGIFAEKGLQLKDAYYNATADYYNGKVQQVDFAKAGSESTSIVNKWIADYTKNRIPKMYKEEILKDTVILLVSTVYFASQWYNDFDIANTETKQFNTGAKFVSVPMMSINESVKYLDDKNSKFEAISIPYMYGDFSMLIILPYRDQSIKTLINSLTHEQYFEIIKSLNQFIVNYQIPRFKFHWSQDIKQQLEKLGIKHVFENAELGNMSDLKNLVVSKVTHAAEIEVSEKGTVASAASGLRIVPKASPRYKYPPIPFYADRPFLFSIYHQYTDVILFTGLLQNPAA